MRRIKKAKVTHLALVKRGANHLPVLYKSADGSDEFKVETLMKAAPNFDELGELLVVAYAPEYRDTQGDIADHEMCKEMGHSFMREGARLNIRHGSEEVPKEKAYVAESFTIQPSDERFHDFKDYSGNEVNVSGGWGALIKIEDKELRRLFREDGWNGVSIQGPYKYVEESESSDNVQRALDLLHKQEQEMKPEELQAILKENRDALAVMVKEALQPAKPAEQSAEEKAAQAAKEAKPKPPEFKGDRLKKEDVLAHVNALKAFRLQETVDWSDPKSVENYYASLAKQAGDDDGSDDGDDTDDQDDEGMRKEAPARRRSEQPAVDQRTRSKVPEALRDARLSKEEIEGLACGQRMADFINKLNGSK